MFSRFSRSWMCFCLIVLAPLSVLAQDDGQYREFRLRSSTTSVTGQIGSPARDLKTVHQRPALLQELAWSPRYSPRRAVPDVDPVREMIFSFYNDQLYRIVVQYDQLRTSGLTDDDIIGALTSVYGPPLTLKTPREEPRTLANSSSSPVPLAQWQRDDTSVSLSRSAYGSAYSLLVSSTLLDGLAREAAKTALSIDAQEAPAREAERAKKQKDDERAAEEKIRGTNKAAFRP